MLNQPEITARTLESLRSLGNLHGFVEIINALIQSFSGHALWTASGGTSFVILMV